MKNYKIYLALIPVLSLLFTGCSDFLDQAPDERLEINTLTKVESTIIGSYQNNRGYRFTHFSTDNVTLAQKVYTNDEIIEDLYTWNRTFRNQKHQDSPSEFWTASYGSISQINHALEALEEISIPVADQGKASAIRGEALVMRSYCHFMLVNLFAKHYDPATAGSDLGVPYVFKPETKLKVNYDRETVAATYQLAEKDLLDGIKLLEENFEYVTKNKYRFTFPSVYNYASRFYTFRNNGEEDVAMAIKYGEKAIDAYGGVDRMRKWKEYQSDEFGPVDIYQPEVGMVQRSRSWLPFNWVYQMTNGIRDEYLYDNPFGNNDDRFTIYWIKKGDVFIPSYYFVYEPGFSEASAHDLFPLSEAIFNAAEGYIRQNDFVKAKELLEVIGGNVYPGYNPAQLTTDLLKTHYNVEDENSAWTSYLLFERRNQYLMKGMRWFDLKRYDIDVTHKLQDGTEIKLSEIAPNKDFQIPLYAISTGMQPNK